MKANKIAGIGEVLWDMLPEGRKPGGAPANFAYHVSQFGLDGCVVSAIGDDPLSDEMLTALDSKGVGRIIAKVPWPTGTVQVEIGPNGVPRYEITENVAWDNIPCTEQIEALARQTKAICFGSLAQRSEVSRITINRFLDAMPRDDDPLVVFDINLRRDFYETALIEESMRRCNILKINDEELEIVGLLFGWPDLGPEEKCRRLSDIFDLKILILTCGANGSYLFTPDGCRFRETPVVKVVDTVGAGDSFTAAFVSSLIKGKPVAEAHETAVEVSAYVCTQAGAMPELPEKYTK